MLEQSVAGAGILILLALITGCGEEVGGPCVHRYEDPVLAIDEVRSTSGHGIDSVLLGKFRIDGTPVDAEMLTRTDAAYGVQVTSAGELRCDVPCGFGTEEGSYVFEVEAEGHESKQVDVVAAYDEFSGGCPSSNSGSTVIELDLSPAS